MLLLVLSASLSDDLLSTKMFDHFWGEPSPHNPPSRFTSDSLRNLRLVQSTRRPNFWARFKEWLTVSARPNCNWLFICLSDFAVVSVHILVVLVLIMLIWPRTVQFSSHRILIS